MESEIKSADLIIKPNSGVVIVNDEAIRLGPVNMKVLLQLVNSEGRLITRDELFSNVWGNQIVSDDTLTRCISDIRNKICKHSSFSKHIITVPKKGYQWRPQAPILNSEIKSETEAEQNSEKKSLKHFLFSKETLLALLLFLTVMFLFMTWVGEKLRKQQFTPLILTPISLESSQLEPIGKNIEDSLRESVLKTMKYRFFSN